MMETIRTAIMGASRLPDLEGTDSRVIKIVKKKRELFLGQRLMSLCYLRYRKNIRYMVQEY
jgi:hypothetical protein